MLYLLGATMPIIADEPIADVYVIKLHGEVTDAMASYLEREIEVAHQNNRNVIIDIDTFGGYLVSADKIINILLNAPIETTAFVSGKAISAGVALTISCDNVAMASSAYMGAAEPIPFSEKTLSAWKGMLSTAAIEKNRPENVIHAMADSRITIDNYSNEGELLSLSSSQATQLGVCDYVCDDISAVVKHFKLGSTFEYATYSMSDKAASVITSTVAMNIFFSLGFALAIIEVFTAGFGVAGALSILCFVLYYFGGIIAGSAQWWSIALFIAGAMAIIIEMFVPGFGIFGIAGIVLCTLGLVFSSSSIDEFAQRAGIAMIVGVVLIPICIAIFGKVKVFDRVINSEVQSIEKGYTVSKVKDYMIGQEAIVINALRPIGIVEINDKRMDAFSEDGYIEQGKTVIVIGKKSSSVIVRKQK